MGPIMPDPPWRPSAPPEWPEKSAAELDDGELLGYARLLYARLREVARWADENDDLLRRWGAVCREMGVRGMTDAVTGGGEDRDAVPLIKQESAARPGDPQ